MGDGDIPSSPLNSIRLKRRRCTSNQESRANACCEFAPGRTVFRSLEEFVKRKRREIASAMAWRPSKGQMVRDMRKIFWDDWAIRRVGGGGGRGSGIKNAENASGLEIPENPAALLNYFPNLQYYQVTLRVASFKLSMNLSFSLVLVLLRLL